MKVNIANLGVIEKAEIDLKPLTVFIGKNGTGKTWAAYTLASILGKHGFTKYCKSYVDGKTQQKFSTIDDVVDKFIQEGNVDLDLVKFAEEYAESYINDIARLSRSWMKEFLGTKRGFFDKTEVKFDLNDVKTAIYKNIKSAFVEQEINFGSKKQNSFHVLKEVDNNNIYFYISTENNFLEKMPKRVFGTLLVQQIFEIIHRAFYRDTYIFPTERTTFITFPAEIKEKVNLENLDNLANLENEYNKDLSKESRLQPSVAIQSFLDILIASYEKNWTQRKEEVQLKSQTDQYVQLADLLENKILQGKVDIDESISSKEILFQPSDNLKLEMTVASSMVKELAPLVLCLRYLAEPDELLIIDEPEMNLHPAAQVEIIEFLAMLVHAGLNVLITTHSPYIVDHLTNLMQAAKYEDKESLKERFYLERTEAFIPQEKVAVYLFEEGTAKNILNEEGRIDWGTFADVSDDISHIFP